MKELKPQQQVLDDLRCSRKWNHKVLGLRRLRKLSLHGFPDFAKLLSVQPTKRKRASRAGYGVFSSFPFLFKEKEEISQIRYKLGVGSKTIFPKI